MDVEISILSVLFGDFNRDFNDKMDIDVDESAAISMVGDQSKLGFQSINIWLVVWNIFLFSHILGIIIPTD